MKVNIPILLASFLVAVGLWFAQRVDRDEIEKIVQVTVRPQGLSNQPLVIVEIRDEINVRVRGPKADLNNLKFVEGYVSLFDAKKGIQNYPVDIPKLKSYLVDEPPTTKIVIDSLASKVMSVVVKDKGKLSDPDKRLQSKILEPREVRVNGAKSYVDRVASIRGEIDLQSIDPDSPKKASVDLQMLDSSDRIVRADRDEALYLSPERVVVDPVVVIAPAEKDVLVSPTTEGSPPDGYEYVGITTKPFQIRLQGPSLTLAQLSKLTTDKIDISNLKETKQFVVSVHLPPKTSIAANGSKSVTVEVKVRKIASVGLNGNPNRIQ